jgi:hypothetical protein
MVIQSWMGIEIRGDSNEQFKSRQQAIQNYKALRRFLCGSCSVSSCHLN